MNPEDKPKPISLLTMSLPRIKLNAKYDIYALKPSSSFIKQQKTTQDIINGINK